MIPCCNIWANLAASAGRLDRPGHRQQLPGSVSLNRSLQRQRQGKKAGGTPALLTTTAGRRRS
jgi:hypothetical protein